MAVMQGGGGRKATLRGGQGVGGFINSSSLLANGSSPPQKIHLEKFDQQIRFRKSNVQLKAKYKTIEYLI